MELHIRGVIPAMVTPFGRNGKDLNERALRELCDFLIERGVSGLFPLGSTGEGALMSLDERKKVANVVIGHVGGRVPVLVHTGAVTTDAAIELTRHARDIGATAASVIMPYYYRHNEGDAYEHYRVIAASVPDLPLYLYYARTGLSPEATLRLRDATPNVVGMKDSLHDFSGLIAHMETLGPTFSFLEGHEPYALPGLALGVDGLLGALATVFPEPLVKLVELFEAGRLREAREQQRLINKLQRVVYGEAPYARIKKALELRGIAAGSPRAPLRQLDAESSAQLQAQLQALGVS